MDKTAASTLLAWLDREVWLVTARDGGRRGGLIATFVGPAAIVPDMPRMAVGLGRQHFTRELVEASGAFALHLLRADNLDWVRHFGLHSGRGGDKFDGFAVQTAVTGSPVLDGAVGWLDCRVEQRMLGGDRTVYLAQVVEGRVTNYGPPLTFKQLMQIAPADILAEMKRQLHHDITLDAEAIRQWRAQHGIESPAEGSGP